MKFVRLAIGAVIAILSVRIIATNVYGMTQETVKNEVVTFEVLTISGDIGTTDINVYNLLNEYEVLDEFNNFINPTSINVNNVVGDSNITKDTGYYTLVSGDNNIFIKPDNVIEDDGSPYPVQVGDVWVITFEVTQPPQLTGISATLILIAPLIFVSGILGMLLIVVPKNKED